MEDFTTEEKDKFAEKVEEAVKELGLKEWFIMAWDKQAEHPRTFYKGYKALTPREVARRLASVTFHILERPRSSFAKVNGPPIWSM